MAIILSVGATTFLLKYNKSIHVSTLSSHLQASSIIRFAILPWDPTSLIMHSDTVKLNFMIMKSLPQNWTPCSCRKLGMEKEYLIKLTTFIPHLMVYYTIYSYLQLSPSDVLYALILPCAACHT